MADWLKDNWLGVVALLVACDAWVRQRQTASRARAQAEWLVRMNRALLALVVVHKGPKAHDELLADEARNGSDSGDVVARAQEDLRTFTGKMLGCDY